MWEAELQEVKQQTVKTMIVIAPIVISANEDLLMSTVFGMKKDVIHMHPCNRQDIHTCMLAHKRADGRVAQCVD